MNGSLQCRTARNWHATWGGRAMFGESLWMIRARSASLHFDHTALAKLIARRWHQDRGPRGGGGRIAVQGSCNELSASASAFRPKT